MANTTVKYKGPMAPDESAPVDNATADQADPANTDVATKVWVANYVKGFMAAMMRKSGGGGMGGGGIGGGGMLGGM